MSQFTRLGATAVFDQDSFDPDTVYLMSRVLRAALEVSPQISSPLIREAFYDEQRRLAMAKKIMAAASKGERNFEVLMRAALQ